MTNGTITIHGATYEITLREVGPGAASRPATPADGLQIEKNVELMSYENKTGTSGPNSKNPGKPYNMWKFKGSDQKDYTTFKGDIAHQLTPLAGTGKTVKLYVRPDRLGKGFDITGLG